jgi:hypothetical protein
MVRRWMLRIIKSKESSQIAVVRGSERNTWRKSEQYNVKAADISGIKRGNI